MQARPITIHVSPTAAQIYETADTEQRLKLDALLSLRLTETTRPSQSLEKIMTEIGRKAQERGLTPEILDELLNEP